jgi:hypothetical protein
VAREAVYHTASSIGGATSSCTLFKLNLPRGLATMNSQESAGRKIGSVCNCHLLTSKYMSRPSCNTFQCSQSSKLVYDTPIPLILSKYKKFRSQLSISVDCGVSMAFPTCFSGTVNASQYTTRFFTQPLSQSHDYTQEPNRAQNPSCNNSCWRGACLARA